MAVKPVVYDDSTKKHRPLGSGEKMDGLSASSIISSQSGNLITTGSDGLAYATGSGIADPAADNLIEATSGGKLKVDMDRVIEWLDGHASDASALASAINVVSDDSGNVIMEGTDNGAYLSKAALANAIGSMTDAQLQALASAIADGQTIVASGGRLIVDPTNATAAKLKKITAVIPKAQGGLATDSSTGKMYVDFDAMSADTKRNIVLSMVDLDGGLAVHDSGAKKGTIYVDFTSMDPAIMRAVVLQMVQQGGGLAVDSAGQLYVDFNTMPTDKFEALLKSLNMLVPFTSNMTFYVDGATGNDAAAEADETHATPFRHIQNCVNYVTANYSLGRFNAYINVAAGTYNESVSLPEFSRGTGKIYIRPASGARDATVAATTNSLGMRGWCFSCSGGYWVIDRIAMSRVENPTTQRNVTTGCVSCSAGTVVLTGIALSQSYPANPSPIGGIPYALRLLWATSGGKIDLEPNEFGVGMAFSFQHDASSDINTEVMYASNYGQIVLSRTTVDAASVDVSCSGSCADFILTINGASLTNSGAGRSLSFSGSGVTGKRYNALNGSFISTGASGPDTSEYFPGDVAGYVDASTYCWYK